jgi:endo-1,4-beta-xylanase
MEADQSIHLRTNRFRILYIGLITLLVIIVTGFAYWHSRGGLSFSSAVSSNKQLDLLERGWDYMPGVSPQADGIHVSYLGRKIVQQDGSPGQENPPVNIYGTSLDVANNFILTAAIKDLNGGASFRLYGNSPIIQDEFRVETKGIDITINGSKAMIARWGEYNGQNLQNQKPIQTTTHTIQESSNHTITLERQNNSLAISIDGKSLATVLYNNYFEKNIQFGVSALKPNNSWVLSDLTAKADSENAIKIYDTQSTAATQSSRGIASLASNKRSDFIIGAATALGPSLSDIEYRDLTYGGNFNAITTENALKWQFIHPQPTIYDFKEADALVDFARKHNVKVQGHTLVFGEANPKWVQDLPTATASDKETVKRTMIDHITQTVDHFKGRIYAWDVVNEPLAEDVGDADPLRRHKWFDAMGENYIALAFKTARQADPKAKLYINDFGLEDDGERWDAMLSLVAKLKSEGVPIDGLGFESHVYDIGDEIDPNVLRRHIQQLAAIGISSHISEIDVHNENGRAAQAKQYADTLDVCLSEPTCTSWTTWGISDRYNLYEADNGTLQSGEDFLWNTQYNPTSGVAALKETLTK